MKKNILALTIVFTSLIFTGCSFITNTLSYKDKTADFVNAIAQKDYAKCVLMMDKSELPVNPDTVKAAFDNLNNILSQNFPGKLNYALVSANKTFSSEKSGGTPPGQTLVFIQIDNSKNVGEVRLLFDDKTSKITRFDIMNVYQPVPRMLGYWLFSILVLGVLAFNIYVIVKLKRSRAPKKWIGYLMIIILNVPTISYFPLDGLHFAFLNFQFMLGISFMYGGYVNSYLAFGLPIGGLIIFYRLSTTRYGDDDIIGIEGPELTENYPNTEDTKPTV